MKTGVGMHDDAAGEAFQAFRGGGLLLSGGADAQRKDLLASSEAGKCGRKD